MTDIVVRLRFNANAGIPDFTNSKLLDEAADDIEQLRDELELWKARAYAEGFVPAAERTS